MSKDKKEKKSKLGSVIGYVVGSAVLCMAAVIVIPEVLPYISGAINKKVATTSNKKRENDDWGPVIEKKK